MLPSEGNILKALESEPDKTLSYSDLLQKFENFEDKQVQVSVLSLLWRMRDDPECPLWFETGWITHTEIVVHLKE